MNWKLIVLGGLAFFVTTMILGMGTGAVIHEGILDPAYGETTEFWRPELNQDPPDMAALMPYWMATGCITSLIIATLFGWVRSSFAGPGWKRGLVFGVFMTIFTVAIFLGYSGVFNLPAKIWIWWAVDSLILYAAGGAVMGLVAQKVAPI